MSLKIKVSKKIKNQCDLNNKVTKSQIEIMDETKKSILCDISHCTNSDAKSSIINCFWDRHRINGNVIKCPLRYKPKQIVKVYKSEISKEEYTIKENVVKFSEISFSTISDNLEVTDAFCSFSCCLAFIRDNKHDRRYDQSEMLLHKIFMTLYKNAELYPSPHWRTLVEYGGYLSINEFRERNYKVKYTYNGPVLDTGYLFSKKINIC